MIIFRVLIQFFIILIKLIQLTRISKSELIMENLFLRQLLTVNQAKKVKPKLTDFDRSFWIALKQTWNKWK
jgi:hypothetical protein